jgi:hypothetical protein
VRRGAASSEAPGRAAAACATRPATCGFCWLRYSAAKSTPRRSSSVGDATCSVAHGPGAHHVSHSMPPGCAHSMQHCMRAIRCCNAGHAGARTMNVTAA